LRHQRENRGGLRRNEIRSVEPNTFFALTCNKFPVHT
jgi:hypothetical protein